MRSMRWHDQLEARQREGQLPGLGDGTTVRTFDAPEAMEAKFHEIHAKSVLNRVPGASKLPFGWTVNTYRGCLHSCSYCLDPDTPILMASGRARAIKDLQIGDEIYGTQLENRYRRYVKTTVLDKWSTVKPAFRLTLADGTELIVVLPSTDGKRGVCVFRSDSVDTVRSVVDGATSKGSKNEFFAINDGNAQGLPA